MKRTDCDEYFMKIAIELSSAAVEHGNEPFGAVLYVQRGDGMGETRATGIWREQH